MYRVKASSLYINTLLHVNFIKYHLRWKCVSASDTHCHCLGLGNSYTPRESLTPTHIYQLWRLRKTLYNKLLMLPPSCVDTSISNNSFKLLRNNLLQFFRVGVKKTYF